MLVLGREVLPGVVNHRRIDVRMGSPVRFRRRLHMAADQGKRWYDVVAVVLAGPIRFWMRWEVLSLSVRCSPLERELCSFSGLRSAALLAA
jgi:hypothetical protein